MKMLNNIKQKIITNIESIYLLTIYLLTISFFWISFFIYSTFIQKKVIYNLSELKSNITQYILVANIFFITLHIIFILYALFLLFSKNNIINISQKYMLTIKNITKMLNYERFLKRNVPYIPYAADIYVSITNFLYELSLKYNHETIKRIPVIIFYVIPRLIVATIFFIEIMFYNRIYYFIISLLLLLIPILWSSFLILFVTFVERGLLGIALAIDITPTWEHVFNGRMRLGDSYSFKPLPQRTYKPNEVEEWGESYLGAVKMYWFAKLSFENYQQQIKPYVTIMTSSLYLLAAIFTLIYILL